jgi:hypothetical protein
MIKKKKISIVVITLLCLLLLIPLVSAETLTGDLGSSGFAQVTYITPHAYYMGWPSAPYSTPIDTIAFHDFENSGTTKSIVAISHTTLFGFDVGAPAGAAIPVTIRVGNLARTLHNGAIIATGTIGYQRYFNAASPPVEQVGGYIYIVTNDDWNVSGLTGHQWLYLDYDHNDLYNCSWSGSSSYGTGAMPADGHPQWAGDSSPAWLLEGNYLYNKLTDTWASYSATKPSGLGITGYVFKHKDQDATLYNSRAYIFNSTGSIITSDIITNTGFFYFNVPNDQIKIGILSPTGVFYNSSVLFTTGGITPTATPTQTPTPALNIATNITITVQSTIGNQPIEGADVELHNPPSGSYGSTDAIGVFQALYVPHYNNQQFEIDVFKSGYNTVVEYFNVPNVASYTYLVKMTPVVSPTPTPISYEILTLSASPDAIGLGQSTALTVTSTNNTHLTYAGGMRTVLYYENYNLGVGSTFNLIGSYTAENATHWKYRQNATDTWHSGTYNPLTLTATPKYPYTYTYQVAVFDLNSISIGTANKDVSVQGGGGVSGLNMIIGAIDGATTSHLSNFTLTLTEDATGYTQDYGYVAYDKTVNLPRGGIFTAISTKEGYEAGSKTFTVPIDLNVQNGAFGTYVNVNLFNNATKPSAGNTTIAVHVDDKETYYPLPNVQIQVSGITNPKFTGSEGESASFIIPQNTTFTVKASKTGYCPVQETKNTSTNEYMYIDLYMKYGACAGVTPTHTPIPNATTVKPTITPIKLGNQTQAFCGVNMSGNATLVDKGLSLAACVGFKDLEQQRLFWAIILILLFAVILAYYAGGMGALIGAGIGVILAIAAGLLDVWILYALILIGALIIGSKLMGGGQGGG